MAAAPRARSLAWRLNVPLVAGLACTLLFGLLHTLVRFRVVRLRFIENLEGRLYDAEFKLRGARRPLSDELAIVGLDDATRERTPEVFQRRAGWAVLYRALTKYQPELIGLDAFYVAPEIVLPPGLVGDIDRFLAAPAPAPAPRPSPQPVPGSTTSPSPSTSTATSPEMASARALLGRVRDETRGDETLAAAIRAAGNVYLGFVAVFDGPAAGPVPERPGLHPARYDEALSSPALPAGSRAPSASGLIASRDEIAAGAAGAAFVNSLPDEDGTIRQSYLVVEHGGRHYAPMGLVLLRRHLALAHESPPPDLGYVAGQDHIQLGARRLPVDPRGRALLDYLGGAESFPTYSAADVIEGKLAPEALRGKVVLVGYTDAARDKVATPFTPLMSGVELHATLFHNALHGELIRRASPTLGLISVLALCLFLSALQLRPLRRSPAIAAAAAALGLAGFLVLAHLAFRARLWIDVAGPSIAYVATAVVTLTAALVTEGREKLKLRGAFEHYVGDRLIDRILADPAALRLGGERRVLTVLFSDIRGFSRFSETLEPEELSRFLNEYLTPMTQIVLDQDGLLDKYIGDALMAVYGAPIVQRDHAARACRAALEMMAELARLNAGWKTAGMPVIAIGIGINTGPVSVGNMGSAKRFDYTVMGDAVNLGSRLEALTKDYEIEILAGESTVAEADADFLFREVDLVRAKGKDRPVRVYQLLAERGSDGEAAARARLDLDGFAEGLTRYRAGDFKGAIAAFTAVLAGAPDDGPAKTLLARARILAEQDLPAGWNGVYDQLTK